MAERAPDPPRDRHYFFTAKEAAAYLRVNINTLYQYARKSMDEGGPPTARVLRNRIRFPREKFIQWAEKRD